MTSRVINTKVGIGDATQALMRRWQASSRYFIRQTAKNYRELQQIQMPRPEHAALARKLYPIEVVEDRDGVKIHYIWIQ